MNLKDIERKIKLIDKNIDYYTRVYNPDFKKVKELKKKKKEYLKKLKDVNF